MAIYGMNSNNTTMTDDAEKNALANNLPGRVMRLSMENKNLLMEKGQIYAGTGNTHPVTITYVDDSPGGSGGSSSVTYNIPITEASPVPSSTATSGAPLFLVFTGEGDTGLKWKTVDEIKTILGIVSK